MANPNTPAQAKKTPPTPTPTPDQTSLGEAQEAANAAIMIKLLNQVLTNQTTILTRLDTMDANLQRISDDVAKIAANNAAEAAAVQTIADDSGQIATALQTVSTQLKDAVQNATDLQALKDAIGPIADAFDAAVVAQTAQVTALSAAATSLTSSAQALTTAAGAIVTPSAPPAA